MGLSALFAKVQGQDKDVLLLDPNPEALLIAAENLIINGLSAHCEFVCSFVGDAPDRQVEFYTIGAGAAGSIFPGHAKTAASIGSRLKVTTTTVDVLVKERSWVPGFIKIDVEGAEHMVLEGMRMTACTHRPWVMVEMHSPPELPMQINAQKVLEWCDDVGYRAWYMKTATMLTDATTIAHRGKCHLLLLPEGVDYPKDLARIPQRASLPDA